MSFDALAMHAVRDELEARLLGGFVEKVVPLSTLEVGLRVRSQHRDFSLLMSADPQSARIHLVSGTLRRLSEEVTPFLLLLRKYVREGRIAAVRQPTLERVIELAVEKRQEDGSTTAVTLIIEAMGRHSNVILVGPDGKVLDALKRVPPSLSRQRPVLPHMEYGPPPPAEKMNPLSPLLDRQLATAARQVGPTSAVWRFLQETVTGLGPLSAREAIYRALGDTSATMAQVTSWQAVADAVGFLLRPLETREWAPCVVVQEGAVLHFAPYLLTQFPEAQLERVETISEAVERAHSERIRTRPAEALRAPLRAAVRARLERVQRKEGSLRMALTRGEQAEGLKKKGQAILANVALIGPGQTELQWEHEVIALDPKLSPSENAQGYFREYTKSRDAAREIPALLEATRLGREYLEQMLTLVELAEGDVELRTLSRELAEAAEAPRAGTGPKPTPRQTRRGQKPGRTRVDQNTGTVKRLTSNEGHAILVGGSAKGNERVTFELGTGGDLWFHARGVPGAHVILKVGGQEPSKRALLEAARLAALHSQARGSGKVPVDYTLQRYVKKVKGGPHGLVTYSQEKTLRVDAVDP
ncbi:MAG: Rqc2 family fibronectin-binding protein [Chloroflexota bacterium]